MKIIGLVPQGQGTNKVFNSCCPSQLKFYVELEPGEPTHNIHRVIWNDPSCGSTILTVGSDPYANPLTNNFLLTIGVRMEVVVDICPCQGVGVIDTYHLEIETQSPSSTHDFYFDFEGIDSGAYNFIDKTSAFFFDCLNDCGRIQGLFTITNPSPLEIPIQLIDTGGCGFAFWRDFSDGNGFVQTTSLQFNIPGNSSAIVGLSNPNCLVTSECDFNLDVDICGLVTETIPITHEQVECGDCSIHCDSIQITSVASNVQILSNSNQIDPSLWFPNIIAPNLSWMYLPIFPYLRGHFSVTNNLTIGETIQAVTYADWFAAIPGFPSTLPNNLQVTHKITFRNITCPFTLSLWTQSVYGVPFTFSLGTANAYSTFTFTEVIPTLANDVQYQFDISFPAGTTAGNYVDILSIELEVAANVPVLTPTNLDCSNLDSYNETAIGEKKYALFTFFYDKGFKPGTKIYFNPFLFSSNACDTNPIVGGVNVPPDTGWVLTVPAVPTFNIGQFYSNTNPITGNLKNYNVNFFILNEYQFQIQFDFFMLQDINNWLGFGNPDNLYALLKNATTNPLLLDNTGSNSVYNFIKKFCAYIYILDPNIIVGQFPNGNSVYYECSTVKSVYFNARFWNLGLNNNPSEMQNPTWLLERNSVAVNDLSTINPTDVTFKVDYGVSIDNAFVYVFNGNTNFAGNNNVDFLTSYQTEYSYIHTTVPTTGTGFGGTVESPSQRFTNIGGNTYELKFRINTNLDTNGDYYIGIVASSNTDNMVNSFLLNVPVKVTPDVGDLCCPLNITDDFIPYTNTNATFPSGGFSPVVQERIQNRLQITPGAFQTCLENYGFDPLTDNWLNYLKKVTLRIYKKTQDVIAPAGLSNVFYMMREFTSTRNAIGGWSNPQGFFFNVAESGTNLYVNSYQRVIFINNTFDSSKVFTATLAEAFNRTQVSQPIAAGLIANNNITWSWADEDIFYEHEFEFNLQGIFTNNTIVKLYNVSIIHPTDYETNPQPFTNILNPLEVYGVNNAGSTLLSTPVVCNNTYDHLLVKVSTNDASNGNLIAMFNDANGNQFTLKEHEDFANSYLQQLTDSPLYDVDATFVGGEAFFKVDLQGLPPGTYKICGLRTLD